jgi:hypothetical protein
VNRGQFSSIVILFLIIVILVPGDSTGQADCTRADELFEAGKYEEARTVYLVLLEKDPDLICAQEGVQEAEAALSIQADHLCQLGRSYEEAGQLELAREAYIDALRKTPTKTDAQEGLTRIDQSEFAPVRTLADLGFLSVAAELLEEIVKEKPGLPVPEDIKYLLGGEVSWLWKVRRLVEPMLSSLSKMVKITGEGIALFAVIGLVIFAACRRIFPWIRDCITHKSFLDINAFNNGVIKENIGEALAEAVEGEFKKVLAQDDSLSLHLVDKPTNFPVPASIKSLSSPVKIVSELIEWAFPQRVIALHGCLQESQNHGAGLTLKLVDTQTGEIVNECMMWQEDYQPGFSPDNQNSTDYLSLAKPAAHWVYFHLSDYSKSDQKKEMRVISRLGTKNWQSFVCFGTGMRLGIEGNKKEEIEMYLRALDKDRSNRFALLALGILKIQKAAEGKNAAEKYREAQELLGRAKYVSEEHEEDIEWLQWVKENKKPEDKKKIHGDTIWYNAVYQLGATYAYQGEWSTAKDNSKLLREAIAETSKTLEACESMMSNKILRLINKQIRGHFKSIKSTKERLEYLKPSVNIQYAIHLVGLNKLDEAQIVIDELEKDKLGLSYRSLYNLACYYSLLGEKEKEKGKSENAYKEALDNLKKALCQEGSIIHWAENDPDLRGLLDNKEEELSAEGFRISKNNQRKKKLPARK